MSDGVYGVRRHWVRDGAPRTRDYWPATPFAGWEAANAHAEVLRAGSFCDKAEVIRQHIEVVDGPGATSTAFEAAIDRATYWLQRERDSAKDAVTELQRQVAELRAASIEGPCTPAIVVQAASGIFRIPCGNCGVDDISGQPDDELTAMELVQIIQRHQMEGMQTP